MDKTIGIIGALDTKGAEFAFLKAEIEKRGFKTLVVDTGVLGEAYFEPDVSRSQVAEAGGSNLDQLLERKDRGEAMAVMTKGVAEVARELYELERIDGIISMGGGGGTVIGTSAMRALPVGFPKLMVSTLASGDTTPYVGTTDITMMPSVVDVAGVNRISKRIYTNAAGAICGMVQGEPDESEDKPLIAASMFGNTTTAVDHAREIMEAKGFEVLVFHATGTGGQTMEALVADGYIAGVLDITTTEWADEICGGVLSAGPHRLEAAAKAGIPQVVVPGCIDMCNFWARDTVPEKYSDRTFYEWNPNVTLMRTTPQENQRMGAIFAEKLNSATAPAAVLIPLKGYSQLDLEGQPFYWPEANQAFIEALKRDLRQDIPVTELDYDINAPEFSSRVAETLLAMLDI
ncbi:MAG: Tm-1-like ATP-binding domain-containing protein [Chloroflexota bacterium]|nr:MAG: Tm-1-like ATP-binding domain-containing protein [Chloroflexota bacterium]